MEAFEGDAFDFPKILKDCIWEVRRSDGAPVRRPDESFWPSAPCSLESMHEFAARKMALAAAYTPEEHASPAFRALDQAVGAWRWLAATDPDRFEPYLAAALSVLGAYVSAIAQQPLNAHKEAVQILRRIRERGPSGSRDLLDALASLRRDASCLAGLRGELVSVTEEIIELYRELNEEGYPLYMAELATELSRLADLFSEVGRTEDAIDARREVVDIYRALAMAVPFRWDGSLSEARRLLTSIMPDLSGERSI